MAPRLLLVEDDDALAENLARQLGRAGFQVERVADGDAALHVALERYDLALLDLMLPGTYGLDVLKRWRSGDGPGASVPVILLTARDHTSDKVRGLSLGADDYVTKPFYPEELVARVHACLRRAHGTSPRSLEAGPLHLDPQAREARLDGVPMSLTRAELDVLLYLAARPGRAIARSEIVEAVLDRHDDAGERALDVHVSRLRKKLGAHAALLATVWGIGYRLDVQPRETDGHDTPPTSNRGSR